MGNRSTRWSRRDRKRLGRVQCTYCTPLQMPRASATWYSADDDSDE